MNRLSSFILVNYPYIWRTRAHLFLFLALSLVVVYYFLGQSHSPQLDNIQSLSETASELSLQQLGITLITLIPVLGYWFYLLYSFPLRDENKKTVVEFIFISMAINTAFIIGPMIYTHQGVLALAHLAGQQTAIEQDDLTMQLICERELSAAEKRKILQLSSKWSGSGNKALGAWTFKIVQSENKESLISITSPKGRKNTINGYNSISRLFDSIRYDQRPGLHNGIRRLAFDYLKTCKKDFALVYYNSEDFLKTNNTIQFKFWGTDDYITTSEILHLKGKLDTLFTALAYKNNPSLSNYAKFNPYIFTYTFLVFILTLVAYIASSKTSFILLKLNNLLSNFLIGFDQRFIHHRFELNLSRRFPVLWAIGTQKLATDLVIYAVITFLVFQTGTQLLEFGKKESTLLSMLGILFIYYIHKLIRQRQYYLPLPTISGNIKKLVLSFALLLPFLLFIVYLFTQQSVIRFSPEDQSVFFCLTILLGFWMVYCFLTSSGGSRLILLLGVIFLPFIQLGFITLDDAKRIWYPVSASILVLLMISMLVKNKLNLNFTISALLSLFPLNILVLFTTSKIKRSSFIDSIDNYLINYMNLNFTDETISMIFLSIIFIFIGIPMMAIGLKNMYFQTMKPKKN